MVEVSTGYERDLINGGIAGGLVLLGGIFSGLTMGILSQDRLDLEILSNSGTEEEKNQANRILPLVNRHHLVLVTLLIANAAVNEALPIFINVILPEYAAVAISVFTVLVFGEVIPQAICSKNGLSIGAAFSWFVWGLIGLFFIVGWPLAKILDFVLGDEKFVYYRRNELKALVQLHYNEDEESGLTTDEVSIIRGAMDLKEISVLKGMTPFEKAFLLDFDERMTPQLLQKIYEAGHSRIPVYRQSRENIIGMILVKQLLKVKPRDSVPISQLNILRIPVVASNTMMSHMLTLFQKGKSHLAIVVDSADHLTVKGIISIENVLEELVGDITDEMDLIRQIRVAAIKTNHSKPVLEPVHISTMLP